MILRRLVIAATVGAMVLGSAPSEGAADRAPAYRVRVLAFDRLEAAVHQAS